MPFEKQVLVLAEDPTVRHTKQLILEQMGFNVIAVGTVREFEYVASRTVFDLVILGRTVTEIHKRQAAQIVRLKQPNTPVLEICNVSPVIQAEHVLCSPNPEDLAEMVSAVLRTPKRSAEI